MTTEDSVDEVKWLIAREIPRLRRYATALVGDAAAADDLVQDCLERALRKRHLWTRRGSVRNWLYRILYNVFVNQGHRRRRVRLQVQLEDAPGAMAQAPRQDQGLICDDIAAAMDRLPEDQRAAIVLTALEGLSYEEAAAVLGIRIGTLRSRLSRGREKLRALYTGHDSRVALRRVK